jgi:hypothetical protein
MTDPCHPIFFVHRRPSAGLPAVVMGLALATVGGEAWAQGVRLVFVRGAELADCPDERGLRMAITRRNGLDPFTPDAPHVAGAPAEVRVSLVAQGDQVQVRVEVVDAQGHVRRTRDDLRGPISRCADLVDAAGSDLALIFQSVVTPTPTPPETPPPPVPPPVPRRVDPAPSPSPAPSPMARIRASLGAGLGFGLLPGAAASVEGGLALGGARWSVGIDLSLSPTTTHRSDQGLRYDAGMARATVALCGHAGWFAGCALLSGGPVWTEGIDASVPVRDQALWLAAGLRLLFEPRLVGRLHLFARVDGVATLRAFSAAFTETSTGRRVVAWSSPPIAVEGVVGLAWHFR